MTDRINPDRTIRLFTEKWLEYQRSPEYKEKMRKAQEIAAANEGVLV